MRNFNVSFTMNCSGTIRLAAESAEEAKNLVENMSLSAIGRDADTGDVEVADVAEDKV